MIDPRQGPFPTPPATWNDHEVEPTPWGAVDDPQDPGGRAIDAPDPGRPVAIDVPAPESSEVPTLGRWMPRLPPGEPGPVIPDDHVLGPADRRPRPR
jgi:hypothetical protein